MKKFFKILGIILAVILAALYIAFLFVLPKVVNLDSFKSDVQKIVTEQSKLNLDYSNLKLVTTPLLGIGFKADDIKITMPDNSVLFSSDSIKSTLSIPHIFLLTARLSNVDVKNPFINIEILKNGEDYKIVKLIEDILNEKKASTFGEKPEVTEEDGFRFNPNWIKIVVPNVKLYNYKVLVKDLGTGHYLDLHGEKLAFGYFNGKSVRVKTEAELFSDDKKNISANINVDTFLPPPSPKLDDEDDPAEKIDISFLNPVKTYQNYDLKTNIDTKIKIRNNKNNGIVSYGHVNIENLTLRISKIQLPESYLRLKTFGKTAEIDTNIYSTKDENINILGKVNYSKHPTMDLAIKTGSIKFQNLLTLAEAFLESVHVQNELNQFKAAGSIQADCKIKTNFKKLKSEGFIKVQNGALRIRNLGEVLSKININILLDNNVLNIADSGLLVEKSPVKINGTIDEKSYTDVNIETDNIPLPQLFRAFAPKNLRTAFNLKSGNLSSKFNLQGKMKKAVAKVDVKLSNFDFVDRTNSFDVKNNEFDAALSYDSGMKNLLGEINNSDFRFIIPSTSSVVSVPKLKVNIVDGDIIAAPGTLKFNDNSVIEYSGEIKNYSGSSVINVIAKGGIQTSDIVKLIGKEYSKYINYNGKIPVQLDANGNKNKITLKVQALGDKDNYITPIDIKSLINLNTSLQAVVDFKPNRIKIKNTGLYTRTSSYNEEGEEVISLNKVMELDGTVEQNRINLMKFEIPQNLDGKIHVFPKSNFTLKNTKLYAFGKSSAPLIRGNVDIQKLVIPELYTTLDNLNIKISGRELTFWVKDLLLKNSDISILGEYSLEPAKIIEIGGLKINSKYMNLDDITSVTESLNKYLPAQAQSSGSASAATQDIPVRIPNGTLNMRKIVTGDINLTNTISQLILNNNILYLRNLSTDIFNGNVKGNIDVNLISLLVGVDLNGTNIDVAKALLDAAGMKDALSGTADFSAKLSIDGSASNQEEQMKGIEGEVSFTAKDGQFGPFGKLENMIIAENIRESQFFQTALGGVINSLSTIDTTHFAELKGLISLKDGICNIDHITSQGNVMNLHILGKFDILKNYADMKVRVKLTSIISNLLGPLNAINPVNLVNSAASMNVVTAKAFSLFCETVTEEEANIMPSFSNKYVDNSATKFQLGVRGDAAKPLTLIKSFKWLATQVQFNNATDFVNSIPEPIEGSTATTIEEVIAEKKALEAEQQAALEAEKKTLKYKLKHLIKKEAKDTGNE